MGFVIARRHAIKLRIISVILGVQNRGELKTKRLNRIDLNNSVPHAMIIAFKGYEHSS